MIQNFSNQDIAVASKVAKLTWGNFYTRESAQIQKLIYEFMVKYYDLNRDFSFSAYDDEFKGFLLASKKDDNNNSFAYLETQVQKLTDSGEKKIALDLFDFLESCGQDVKECMNHDDIMLGLFVSLQKGIGKKLLAKLGEKCIEQNIKKIYLWSDTTCDYDYYEKNGFKQIKKSAKELNGNIITTYVFCKNII